MVICVLKIVDAGSRQRVKNKRMIDSRPVLVTFEMFF